MNASTYKVSKQSIHYDGRLNSFSGTVSNACCSAGEISTKLFDGIQPRYNELHN